MADTDEDVPVQDASAQQPAAQDTPLQDLPFQSTPGRTVRATALGRGTHGVPELRLLVEGALHTAFPHRTWIAGRVGSVVHEAGQGLSFTLHAATDPAEPFELFCHLAADVLPQVADVLDRVHDADVPDLVAEGRLARVGGLLRYDVLRATLVLTVSELDPAPTLRGLQEERESLRAQVLAAGLAERQRARSCRSAPLSITLVGPADDPALARVGLLLRESPYAVDLRQVAVVLSGREASAALAGAVREAGLRSDLVVLTRSPGRPLALGVFDAGEVSYAVAQSPVPVVAALGGEGETTVTDEVAHVSLPDGDAAARWVLSRLREAERSLDELAGQTEVEAIGALDRAEGDLLASHDELERMALAAHGRAAVARRRSSVRALSVALLLVLACVVAAAVLGSLLPLLGIGVVAVGLVGLWAARAWAAGPGHRRAVRRTGSRRMSQQDDDFAAVLARLRQVRDELATTSSPETVRRLRAVAAALVGQGEQILGRELRSAQPYPSESGASELVAVSSS